MAKPTVAGRLPLDCVSLVGPGQLIVGRGGMRPKGYAVGGLGGEDDRRGTVGEAERNGGVWWGSSSARLAYLAQVWGRAARSHLTRGTAGRVCCCGHLMATQIGVGSRWSVWQRWWLLLDTTLASLFDQMPFYR